MNDRQYVMIDKFTGSSKYDVDETEYVIVHDIVEDVNYVCVMKNLEVPVLFTDIISLLPRPINRSGINRCSVCKIVNRIDILNSDRNSIVDRLASATELPEFEFDASTCDCVNVEKLVRNALPCVNAAAAYNNYVMKTFDVRNVMGKKFRHFLDTVTTQVTLLGREMIRIPIRSPFVSYGNMYYFKILHRCCFTVYRLVFTNHPLLSTRIASIADRCVNSGCAARHIAKRLSRGTEAIRADCIDAGERAERIEYDYLFDNKYTDVPVYITLHEDGGYSVYRHAGKLMLLFDTADDTFPILLDRLQLSRVTVFSNISNLPITHVAFTEIPAIVKAVYMRTITAATATTDDDGNECMQSSLSVSFGPENPIRYGTNECNVTELDYENYFADVSINLLHQRYPSLIKALTGLVMLRNSCKGAIRDRVKTVIVSTIGNLRQMNSAMYDVIQFYTQCITAYTTHLIHRLTKRKVLAVATDAFFIVDGSKNEFMEVIRSVRNDFGLILKLEREFIDMWMFNRDKYVAVDANDDIIIRGFECKKTFPYMIRLMNSTGRNLLKMGSGSTVHVKDMIRNRLPERADFYIAANFVNQVHYIQFGFEKPAKCLYTEPSFTTTRISRFNICDDTSIDREYHSCINNPISIQSYIDVMKYCITDVFNMRISDDDVSRLMDVIGSVCNASHVNTIPGFTVPLSTTYIALNSIL